MRFPCDQHHIAIQVVGGVVRAATDPLVAPATGFPCLFAIVSSLILPDRLLHHVLALGSASLHCDAGHSTSLDPKCLAHVDTLERYAMEEAARVVLARAL